MFAGLDAGILAVDETDVVQREIHLQYDFVLREQGGVAIAHIEV